jgi:type IV secretion system protein VirB10
MSDPTVKPEPPGGGIEPLPGEAGIPDVAAPRRAPMSKKGLLAVALLILSLIAVSAVSIQRFVASGKKPGAEGAGDKPTAASMAPRRPDMSLPPAPVVQASRAPERIPALVPTREEIAEPIGVRRTADPGHPSGGPPAIPPEDAPVVLVFTRPGVATPSSVRHESPRAGNPVARAGEDPNAELDETSRTLEAYQQQLQGLLDSLTRSTAAATGLTPAGVALGGTPGAGPLPAAPFRAGPSPGGAPLFGGQLQGSSTPKVAASMLGNRSLTLPKGTAFTCALKTKVISATSGLVGCQVQRNVYSDDGRVLLIERGSHLDGEYRIASVRPGTVRIPVLWTRIRTPLGVTVDIDSPGTGQLGESGIDGHVDNRWGERIGAAMLLSLIDDSVKLVIQNQANDRAADTIVLPSTTANTSKLAEKVLDSTINIPPLIYQNQGGIVGIVVARDLDFSSVYELKPTETGDAR